MEIERTKMGPKAKPRNRAAIEGVLHKIPDASGPEISKLTGLSITTVYAHLREIKKSQEEGSKS